MRAVGVTRRQLVAIWTRRTALAGVPLVGVPLGDPAGERDAAFFCICVLRDRHEPGADPAWQPRRRGAGGSRTRFSRAAPRDTARPAPACSRRRSRAARCPPRRSGDWSAPRTCGFLPRTAQIGLRSVGRRRRRSISTKTSSRSRSATCWGSVALATGVTQITHDAWDDLATGTSRSARTLRRPLDSTCMRIPGCAGSGRDRAHSSTTSGWESEKPSCTGSWRTRTSATGSTRARHTRADEAIAGGEWRLSSAGWRRPTGSRSAIALATGTGAGELPQIGAASNIQENGKVAFIPLATARADVLDVGRGQLHVGDDDL